MDQKLLSLLYGISAVPAQERRYEELKNAHRQRFGERIGLQFVSAPGRTEIAGNHTDHNHGRVLAAAINLDTIAAAAPNEKSIVTLHSAGYSRPFIVDLHDFSPRKGERETSLSLIRGVASRMNALGYKVGGFDAAVTSTVFKGSGLSSSAAFEVLICTIFDALYNGMVVEPKLRAKIARYAENEYFGKPCGLMDQMASSVGGLVAIDFAKDDPDVQAMAYDFEAKGYALVVVSAGGEHGNLTADYAAMPREMKAVAQALGGQVLRDIDPAVIEGGVAKLKGKVSDRAILRALHFIDEDARVPELVTALQADDLTGFFEGIIESGESSWKLLQNIYTTSGENQEMSLALELSRRLLSGRGAWRIHGGGFAGTILAFVPLDFLPEYARRMNEVFGENSVTPLMLRPLGAIAMTP